MIKINSDVLWHPNPDALKIFDDGKEYYLGRRSGSGRRKMDISKAVFSFREASSMLDIKSKYNLAYIILDNNPGEYGSLEEAYQLLCEVCEVIVDDSEAISLMEICKNKLKERNIHVKSKSTGIIEKIVTMWYEKSSAGNEGCFELLCSFAETNGLASYYVGAIIVFASNHKYCEYSIPFFKRAKSLGCSLGSISDEIEAYHSTSNKEYVFDVKSVFVEYCRSVDAGETSIVAAKSVFSTIFSMHFIPEGECIGDRIGDANN